MAEGGQGSRLRNQASPGDGKDGAPDRRASPTPETEPADEACSRPAGPLASWLARDDGEPVDHGGGPDDNGDAVGEAGLAEPDSGTECGDPPLPSPEAAHHGQPAPTDQEPDADPSTRPPSPGDHVDRPSAKRQHDGPASDQRRAKRRRTRRKRLRLQETALKRQAKLARKRKRGHGLATVGELGLPTPTEGTFPAALADDIDAAVRDDFRTDWQLLGTGPQGLVSSPPRLPDPMDDSPDPKEVAAREQARRDKQEAKEKAKRQREEARLERDKARREKKQAKEEARLEKQQARDEARLERQQAREKAQREKQQAKEEARLERQQARERAQRERQQAREEALRQREIAQREKRDAWGQPRSKRRRRTGIPSPAPSPPAHGLLSLPAEVRLRIYRELLVAERPILVYNGWRAVYKRNRMRARDRREGQKVCLPTGILRTCRLVYREAVGVLYGDNSFHYRLRDPSPAVVDVSRLADDGGAEDPDPDSDGGGGGGDESASDWEQGNAPPPGSRRRPRKAEADIGVVKHRGLFRRIVVEAEHNRFSKRIMESMARAIRTFATSRAPAPGADASPGAQSNIRTLSVRVAPLRDPFAAPGSANGSFVDFFAPGSPVFEAMQDVRCQFLRVDLMTHMDGASEKAGGSLTIDRRHELISRTCDGFWARDPAMQERRQDEVGAAVKAMKNLGQSVAEFCNAYVSGFAGGLDAMEHTWEEFDDVEEDS